MLLLEPSILIRQKEGNVVGILSLLCWPIVRGSLAEGEEMD